MGEGEGGEEEEGEKEGRERRREKGGEKGGGGTKEMGGWGSEFENEKVLRTTRSRTRPVYLQQDVHTNEEKGPSIRPSAQTKQTHTHRRRKQGGRT